MEADTNMRTAAEGTFVVAPLTLQARSLQMFTVLYALQPSFQRELVLCLGDDEFAPALALAVLGLGGTCLTLDSDLRRLQTAGRGGAVDFTVSSLTEALRILKNEVRKGTPVSVGLAGLPEPLIVEMLHRGVQPDLVCTGVTDRGLLEPFVGSGSLRVSLPPVLPSFASSWHLSSDVAATMVERRNNDARMLRDVSARPATWEAPEDLHRNWLKMAPRLFPRDRDRMYWGTT